MFPGLSGTPPNAEPHSPPIPGPGNGVSESQPIPDSLPWGRSPRKPSCNSVVAIAWRWRSLPARALPRGSKSKERHP